MTGTRRSPAVHDRRLGNSEQFWGKRRPGKERKEQLPRLRRQPHFCANWRGLGTGSLLACRRRRRALGLKRKAKVWPRRGSAGPGPRGPGAEATTGRGLRAALKACRERTCAPAHQRMLPQGAGTGGGGRAGRAGGGAPSQPLPAQPAGSGTRGGGSGTCRCFPLVAGMSCAAFLGRAPGRPLGTEAPGSPCRGQLWRGPDSTST